MINNKILTVFISIVMVLSFGCIEVYDPEPQIDMSSDTRTIDGYDRHIEINAIELIVHGFNNNVTVINNDIEKIVVSGVNILLRKYNLELYMTATELTESTERGVWGGKSISVFSVLSVAESYKKQIKFSIIQYIILKREVL
ncbi:MAG: hypothetical protein K8R19_11120 [Methanosarcinales archaeon]|nr:hypothetical protein [Methanosarcinales archaeon]